MMFFDVSYFMYLICKVVDYLIDPFVAGTSAADPESLSVSDFALNLMSLFQKTIILYSSLLCSSLRSNDQMKHSFPDLWNIEKRYLFHLTVLYSVT